MSVFGDWLYWQLSRPDAVGDVARDVMPDGRCSDCPRTSSLTAWRAYLVGLGADDAELNFFVKTWIEWKTGGRVRAIKQ